MSHTLRFNIKYVLHTIFWSISFLRGILETFSLAPSFFYKLNFLILFCIVLLNYKSIKIKPFEYLYILLFILYSITIGLFNNIEPLKISYFLRLTILYQFVYIIILYNETDESLFHYLKKLIIFFFIIQIPVSFIKFIIVGNTEMYVGTVSFKEGSVTTLITMFGVLFCYTKFLFYKNINYIFYIILFIIFSQIGGKRAVFLLIPIFIFSMHYVYVKYVNKENFFSTRISSYNILSFFMILFGIYFILMTNSTFSQLTSLDSIAEFIISYENRNNVTIYDYSRIQSLIYLFTEYLSKNSIYLFFGFGSGYIISLSESNLVTELLGIRYGARMSLIWIILQVGIVGMILYINIFLKYVYNIYNLINPTRFLVFFLFCIILFDIFFYSSVTLYYFIFTGSFFFFALYEKKGYTI